MEFTMDDLRPSGIDAALQAEKRGSQPPRGYASCREYLAEVHSIVEPTIATLTTQIIFTSDGRRSVWKTSVCNNRADLSNS